MLPGIRLLQVPAARTNEVGGVAARGIATTDLGADQTAAPPLPPPRLLVQLQVPAARTNEINGVAARGIATTDLGADSTAAPLPPPGLPVQGLHSHGVEGETLWSSARLATTSTPPREWPPPSTRELPRVYSALTSRAWTPTPQASR